MAMNMSSGSGGDPEPMMEMNMTPMIDVMLVLIIMFITTLPIANNSVSLTMPPPTPPLNIDPPEVVKIDVDFDGTITWNGEVVNRTQLEEFFVATAAKKPQPEVHLQPNRLVSYKVVAGVMAAAQSRGITKLGMVGNEQFLK